MWERITHSDPRMQPLYSAQGGEDRKESNRRLARELGIVSGQLVDFDNLRWCDGCGHGHGPGFHCENYPLELRQRMGPLSAQLCEFIIDFDYEHVELSRRDYEDLCDDTGINWRDDG